MDEHRTTGAATESPMGQLYTVEEVAGFLRVTQRAVQVWIKSGTLPAVRFGRLLRIRQADLAHFGKEVGTHAPPAEQAQE